MRLKAIDQFLRNRFSLNGDSIKDKIVIGYFGTFLVKNPWTGLLEFLFKKGFYFFYLLGASILSILTYIHIYCCVTLSKFSE